MSDHSPSAPTSTRSSPPMYTPSSTAFSFGEHRPFRFDVRSTSPQAPTASISSRSGTPHFTPSSSSSTSTDNEGRNNTPSFGFANRRTSSRASPVRDSTSLSSFQFTPISTAVSRNRSGRVPTPIFRFRSGSASAFIPPATSSTTSATPILTPSATSSATADERVTASRSQLRDEDDPDRPLPSVETDSSTNSRQDTPSTTMATPSNTTHEASAQQSSERHCLDQDFNNLTLSSPDPVVNSPPLQRNTSTPSIHVTPAASTRNPNQNRENRTNSITEGITAMHLGSHSHADSPRMRESRSPTPTRPRRSGSEMAVDRHSVENESLPNSQLYLIEMREALANARRMASRMVDVLSSANLHREAGSSIENLHQQALQLQAFELPSSRIVGLVGDSGVGKSSLINSLLDMKGLARAGGSGAACTCVVTEYHFHQRNNFVLDVEYFTMDQLRGQYTELLRAYRDNDSPPTDATQEDREALRQTADLAKDTFRASFGSRLEHTPAVLLALPFAQAVDTMVEWATQILSQQPMRQELFSTAEALSARLSELTTEIGDSDPGRVIGERFWPFVCKLRVHLNAYILSKGLIIADLPGLRDLNSARQKVTERYILRCHQILVVARIERAITDQGIRDVFDLARRDRPRNIGIVFTRSDDIQPGEARADFAAERDTIDQLQSEIDAEAQEIITIQEDIDEIEEIDVEDRSREVEQEYARLLRERQAIEKSKAGHEFDLKRHIISIRNEKVSHGIADAYRNHRGAASMRIFCVSNKIYWKRREKSVRVALPYLNLSGILELRCYCIGIVAESHLRAATEYINNRVPAVLGSVAIWVEAGAGSASAERREQVLVTISSIQHELDELTSPMSQFTEISHTLNEEFDTRIRQNMRQHNAQWSADAKRASMIWQGWSQPTYAAFCRKYGTHTTEMVGYHRWNEEAMASMNRDLEGIWRAFNRCLETQFDRIKCLINDALGSAIRLALITARTAEETRLNLNTLAATLRHRRNLILHSVENSTEHFNNRLLSLSTDAFSSAKSAFIGQLMKDVYDAAISKRGISKALLLHISSSFCQAHVLSRGSDRDKKTIITNGFGSPSLFINHARKMRDGFREIANELENMVIEGVRQQVAHIETDLQMLRDENVVLDSERNPEFRNRVAAELRRVRTEMDGIRRTVEEVNARSSTT